MSQELSGGPLVSAMGETETFDNFTSLVPESHYKVMLSLGQPDVTEEKGAPYIELTGTVVEGPFEGTEISRRKFLTPGGVKIDAKTGGEKGGGAIMLLHSLCRQITGKPADETVYAQFGYSAPSKQAGETDKDYGKRLRLEFARFFETLDPAARLDMMLKALRVSEWAGKVVVAEVKLDVREGDQIDENTGQLRVFTNNEWGAIYALNHPKKGAQILAKAHAEQEKAIEESN